MNHKQFIFGESKLDAKRRPDPHIGHIAVGFVYKYIIRAKITPKEDGP